MGDQGTAGGQEPTLELPVPPGARLTWALIAVSVAVIAATSWLSVRPGAAEAQTAFVTWINDPPQPLAALLAATNWVLRPLPLTVVALALVGWIMTTARGASRWEVVRALVIGFALCELVTQVLKRLADQPRPTASIPGLDVHGYPKDPFGNAFPSAHTSVVVGLVTAVWPWLTSLSGWSGPPSPCSWGSTGSTSGHTGRWTSSEGQPSGCSRGRCAGWWPLAGRSTERSPAEPGLRSRAARAGRRRSSRPTAPHLRRRRGRRGRACAPAAPRPSPRSCRATPSGRR